MSRIQKIRKNFYLNQDVVKVASELLGKVLCSKIDGTITKGIIVETEAYRGRNDRACHANNGKRTKRTEVMYSSGGVAYVYLCYGIHHLFNIVTNVQDRADAVLVRALEPYKGIETMKARRKLKADYPLSKKIASGPGTLTQAMGITTALTGTSLTGGTVWLEDHHIQVPRSRITRAPRVGIDYAGEHAERLWRFYIADNPFISKSS